MTTVMPPAPKPARNCDLVMKGGITSGIVYPLALVELSEAFTFRNIGGTSAGAIAAAAAAAAELGGRNRPGVGFEKLRTMPEELGRDTLFSLFQPQERTAPLFGVTMALLQRGWWRKAIALTAAAIEGYPSWLLVGVLPAALLLWLSNGIAPGVARWAAGILAFGLAIVGVLLAFIAGVLHHAFTRLPANNFGLCKGYDAEEHPRRPGLITWLIAELDALAGRTEQDEPLTLADLYGRDEDGAVHTEGMRVVNLQMMTTNLTHGRPYSLPFLKGGFYFEAEEMRQYFPESIVQWMIEHPPEKTPGDGADERHSAGRVLPDGRRVHAMPSPADTPVVVMTRLSLSFPGLFAAVPLHAVDYRRRSATVDAPAPGEDPPPERCWFSDGGICSNLPIHFFDALIPRWPTFAIDLRDFDRFHPKEQDESRNVFMPTTYVEGLAEWWNRFDEDGQGRAAGGRASVFGFIFAIVDSAREWHENLQSRVAGYRDRVATVKVDEGEGGLNLAMDDVVLQSLVIRGRLAGRMIRDRYTQQPADEDGVSWPNHRWVRFRNAMSAMQQMLERARHAFDSPAAGDESWDQLIARPHRSYRWNKGAGDPLAATQALLSVVDAWDADGVDFRNGAPTPVPDLRVTPRA
jgi:predicted acylesterase/phospholipase RssA